MLIANLQPIKSTLSKLKEIPDTFFSKLEDAKTFDNTLFPYWLTNSQGNPIVFSKTTELRNRFKDIYDKYKSIDNLQERKKIINAYFDTNKILELCNNDDHLQYFELDDLHIDVRKEIDAAFLYLYKNALNHTPFEKLVNDTIVNSLRNFITLNKINICPFCGLEMIYLIEGQARLPLDHWLNRDRFPFASINFDNLIPMGIVCNSTGVKGSKNVLKDIKMRPKKRAFYPYSANKSINVSVVCITEPNINNEFGDWNFSLQPTDNNEKDFFESWDYIFNISIRYKSFFYNILLPNWKDYYVEFINDVEEGIEVIHAQTVNEFKENLKQWKKGLILKRFPAAIVFRTFIDFLLKDASEEYLTGEVENFKSKFKAGVI